MCPDNYYCLKILKKYTIGNTSEHLIFILSEWDYHSFVIKA